MLIMILFTDTCILGDQPGAAFNSMSCDDLMYQSPSYCYQDKVRARCCKSCQKHYTWRKGVCVHAFTIDKLFTQPASHHGLLSATRETPSGWRFAGGSIVARFNELIKKLLIRLMRFRFYSITLLFLFKYMLKANMQISLHVCTV